jgi:hypothetical protein
LLDSEKTLVGISGARAWLKKNTDVKRDLNLTEAGLRAELDKFGPGPRLLIP